MTTTNTVCFAIKFILRIFGIWPDTSCAVLRRFFWSITLIVAQIFQYGYFIVHLHTDDLADLMDNLSCNLAYSLLFFKLIVFWINQRKFRDILTMIAADWKESSINTFDMHVTTKAANLSHYISNAIIGLHMVAVVTYSIGVFLSDVEDNNYNMSGVPVRALILKMQLPFESSDSPIYEIVIITQFFHLLLCASMIDALNALIMTLILHVGGQIDILRKWLTNAFSKQSLNGMSGITMKSLIGKHQKIIIFSKNVESLYTYIALLQFISNTLIICCIGFVIITSLGNANASMILMKTSLYYIVMNLEAFTFCYAGEYLSTKSKHIADAAYESLWYDVHTNESRMISFLILRSQKRLRITIGKIMDLSLERFAGILKASASYMSVLVAMS